MADELLFSVLDAIEDKEAKLLTWGIVDGSFSWDELDAIIEPLIERAIHPDPDHTEFLRVKEVVKELISRGWIFEISLSDAEKRYRSRMAETVRLLQRLRQLFPKHRGPGLWRTAPELIADFRFLKRKRRYPSRTLTRDKAFDAVSQTLKNPLLLKSLRKIIDSLDHDFRFAGFQVRAMERILRSIEQEKSTGTIICAGTSSGKTLAFYVPAFTAILDHLSSQDRDEKWVKVVALYPRNELLKDQLREVLTRLQNLNRANPGTSRRPIRVGVWYSDTPFNAEYCKWDREGDSLVCPIISCLDPKCGSSLVWRKDDRELGREILRCRGCNKPLDETSFLFTRTSLSNIVPDILFTTTEMMNQRLSDSQMSHLFGVGDRANRAPDLVLLDEVHTYEGRHGAQVGYVMRRWQSLLRQPLRFVGLSATLRESRTFFSTITGCYENLVDEITPLAKEMESEGSEYTLALRGDPVSRAALLSTTIQTVMVMQRSLDPPIRSARVSRSKGAFGQRTFVFADNLDIINRLYFDLLNAEGRDSYGRPDQARAPHGGLAYLREQGPSLERFNNGQDWRFLDELRGGLNEKLRIQRVSSQDRGVQEESDVIVATASLEVGFDDPTVGVVIQHKAPRHMAGFIQRKGRAGRQRGMRPWTVVVLSDYGRDRNTYQQYEQLFDPELPIKTLPMTNHMVMRVQGVYAMIDYLGLKTQRIPGSVWRILSGEDDKSLKKREVENEIQLILETENGRNRFTKFLKRSLKLSPYDTDSLLWEYPRPLMTTVLPTAKRRLSSNWNSLHGPATDLRLKNSPLPDFAPGTLFSDINMSDVQITLPISTQVGSQPKANEYSMQIYSCLREFSPGRVSRRYGIKNQFERYWIPPATEPPVSPSNLNFGVVDVDSIGDHIFVGKWSFESENEPVSIDVFQPIRIRPSNPSKNIKDSSNARPTWKTQIVATFPPTRLEPPIGGVWKNLISSINFFTHSQNCPIEVRRFCNGSTSEVLDGRERQSWRTSFVKAETSVALGSAYSADSILWKFQVPTLRDTKINVRKWQALRIQRFFDEAWTGKSLQTVGNPFARDWLAQTFLSALTYEAVNKQCSLSEANENLRSGHAEVPLVETLNIIFQSSTFGDDSGHSISSPDRLRSDLEAYLRDPKVLDDLHSFSEILWATVSEEWDEWLRGVFHSTLSAAIVASIGDLCPSIDADEIVVDLSRGVDDQTDSSSQDGRYLETWLSERHTGGGGFVDEFLREYSKDPRKFFGLVHANLRKSEFELIDEQLSRFVTNLVTSRGKDSTFKSAELVDLFRGALENSDLVSSFDALRKSISNDGFYPFHGFWVALSNRILRKGSGPASDEFIASSLCEWDREVNRLGIEIDLRLFSYYLSQKYDIETVVTKLGVFEGTDRATWRMGTIYGLLWPRGRLIRQNHLQLRNEFQEFPPVERLIMEDLLSDERTVVPVCSSDWWSKTEFGLSKGELITLLCPITSPEKMSEALNYLITNSIDSSYLRSYARLQGVGIVDGMIQAHIELVEAPQ